VKEENGKEMHIASAKGRKRVKNMETVQIIWTTTNACVLG
jgi:hypothetical protein